MNRLRYVLPLAVLLTFATVAMSATVPALTPAEKQQLASTVDGPGFDQAGLYALLENVAKWHPANNPTAHRLDFDALLKHPAAHRGQLVRIRGQYAGQSKRILLARSGSWGNAVTRWGILTNRAKDRVVIVAFVDPHDQIKPPRTGQRVTVVGRFYKLWQTTNLNHKPAHFLVFVARSPRIDKTVFQHSAAAVIVGMVILILFIVFIFLIAYLRRDRPTARHARARDSASHRDRDTLEDSGEADPAQPLPDDPAKALDELARRHEPHDES